MKEELVVRMIETMASFRTNFSPTEQRTWDMLMGNFANSFSQQLRDEAAHRTGSMKEAMTEERYDSRLEN